MPDLDLSELPRAWASRATFASGRNFCGLEIENRAYVHSSDEARTAELGGFWQYICPFIPI